jgi:hypothetical protein
MYDLSSVDLQPNTFNPDANSPISGMSPIARKVVASLLCIVGVQVWLIFGHGLWGSTLQVKAMGVALIIAALPPVWRPMAWLLDRLRRPTNRQRWMIAVAVGVVSFCFLLLMARLQDRRMIPRMHDEFSYLLQARMLSHFRLWMGALPLPEFFDSFHIFVTPVYASKYPPGTALALVPALWLGLPAAISCLVAASIAVAMLYRVTTELVDGVGGLLAALLLLSLNWFRAVSLMIMPQAIFLAVVLAMVWAYLRWRNRFGWGWVVMIGAAAGWMAILRPLEAICWTIPIGIAMALDLRGRLPRQWIAAAAMLLAGAAPFLLLQLIANIGVTGHWYKTPWVEYARRDIPYEGLGFHEVDPARRPESKLPQKQMYYDLVNVPAQLAHTPDRIWSNFLNVRDVTLANSTLPNPILLMFLPISLLAWTGRRWVLMVPLLLFLSCFTLYYFFFDWYCLAVAPAMVVGVVVGIDVLRQSWPGRRWLEVMLIGVLLAACVASLPRAVRERADEPMQLINQESINATLSQQVSPPAIVLFKFDQSANLDAEPVYNTDTLNPDDEPIIRVHDLGGKNEELFRYYAGKGPDRGVYVYDRKHEALDFIGHVSELTRTIGQ